LRGFGGVSRMVHKAKHEVNLNEISFKIEIRIGVFELHWGIDNNGLRLKEVGAFEAQTFF
jgi:hypothetical protein